MENPDVEIEVKRDEHGLVTGMAYKVSRVDEERKNVLELCSMAAELFAAEGPEDHSTTVNVEVH